MNNYRCINSVKLSLGFLGDFDVTHVLKFGGKDNKGNKRLLHVQTWSKSSLYNDVKNTKNVRLSPSSYLLISNMKDPFVDRIGIVIKGHKIKAFRKTLKHCKKWVCDSKMKKALYMEQQLDSKFMKEFNELYRKEKNKSEKYNYFNKVFKVDSKSFIRFKPGIKFEFNKYKKGIVVSLNDSKYTFITKSDLKDLLLVLKDYKVYDTNLHLMSYVGCPNDDELPFMGMNVDKEVVNKLNGGSNNLTTKNVVIKDSFPNF